AAEALIERVLRAERLGAASEGADVRLLAERLDDDVPDLPEVVLDEAAHRGGRGADADARGDGRRPLVERDGVAVDRQLHLGEPLLRVLSAPLRWAKVELEHVRVG